MFTSSVRRRSGLKLCLPLALILLLGAVACGKSGAGNPGPPAPFISDTSAARPASGFDAAPVSVPAPEPLPLAWAGAPVLKQGAPAPPAVSALAAVIIDEGSNAVLFDKDAHLPLPPASLTKIATLIVALEHGGLDQWVESDVDSRTMRGSSVMGLLPGDRFPLLDLLYGLVLPSGNDAALAIARYVSGSDEAFVDRMNALLARLGLSDSHFANPHGLGGVNHVASAFDLAELARYGMSLPGFKDIVTASTWDMHGSREVPLENVNTFLSSYRGADGVKTGYTRRAGQTLVASATRDGHRLYAVVLNAPQRNSDAGKLLNWAFASFTWPS
jgi:D-alanyl-D-alanine carboxypeptidase (penicillin-binding protein 5/6)